MHLTDTHQNLHNKIAALLCSKRDIPGLLSAILSEVNQVTSRDSLTGLYNRHHFNTVIHRCQHADDSEYIVVAYIDINRFKSVNDRYGHAAGDNALCLIAQELKKACRKEDAIFRVSGDEFCILIESLQKQKISTIAERLNQQLQNTLKNSQLITDFAFGIATGEARNIQMVIHQADQRMYQHKISNKHLLEQSEL